METGKEGVLILNWVIRVSLMKVKYKQTSKRFEAFHVERTASTNALSMFK